MNSPVIINGETYVPANELFTESNHICVISDRGWIFEGYIENNNKCRLCNANVVRKWSNGMGIGGLADPEHKDDYTLDYIGSIELNPQAVIATIPLRW